VTVAYNALLASVGQAIVVLAEIQPLEILGVWTKEGGYTNVYSTPWASTIQTAAVPGGLYRRLDKVRGNATDFSLQASEALVDSHANSYFYDGTKLYVNIGGSSPDTLAMTGAFFTIFFASTSVSFSDQPLYEPRLADTWPSIVTEKPDPLFGATQADTGSLAVSNADGLFDEMARRYVWRNKTVTFKMGGVGLAYSDYSTIGVMLINAIAPDDDVCAFTLEVQGAVLNQSIPPQLWADGVDAVSVQATLAQYKPWLLGHAKDCKLPMVADDVYEPTDSIFRSSPAGIVAGDLTQVNAMYAVNKSTGAKTPLVLFTDYSPSVGALYSIINATYQVATSSTYEIWADLQSEFFDVPTFGAAMVRFLQLLGVETAQIDTAAFTALDTNAPAMAGLYLVTPAPAADILRVFEQSLLGQIYHTTAGLWTIRRWDPSSPAQYSISDADIVSWTPTEDLKSSVNEVRINYDMRQATGTFTQAVSSDSTVQYANETSDSVTIPSYLLMASDASALANHMRFLKCAPSGRYAVELRGLELMTASAGDMVSVTRARGPIARTGRLDGQFFEIMKIEKVLGPIPMVRVELEDLGGQTDRIGRCTNGTSPTDWSTAAASDRALYMFCSDTNGYVDPTDPQTLNGKVPY